MHFDWSYRTLLNKQWENNLFAAYGGSPVFRHVQVQVLDWLRFLERFCTCRSCRYCRFSGIYTRTTLHCPTRPTCAQRVLRSDKHGVVTTFLSLTRPHPVIAPLLEHQPRAIARRNDVLAQVHAVDGAARSRRAVSSASASDKRGVTVEVRVRIAEHRLAQRPEPGDVPRLDVALVGVDVDREVEEIRHEHRCAAAGRAAHRSAAR